MKDMESDELDQESEFKRDQEELPGSRLDSGGKSKRGKEKTSVADLIQANVSEQVQYVTNKIATRHGKSGLNDLDIETIFRDAVIAYRDGNSQEFDDLMTIILAKYNDKFKTAPKRKIFDEPKEFKGKYYLILRYIPEQEILDNAYFFYLNEIMERIKNWAENGIPSDVDFSFRSQMNNILYKRIYNHFDSVYFRVGDPRIGVDYYAETDDDDRDESDAPYYRPIRDSRINTEDAAISRMEREQEFYSILSKDVRADKVIGSIYRVFLDYSDDMFWAEAIGKSFIVLFDRFIDEFGRRFDLHLTGREIDDYRKWLKKWKIYEEKLGIYIDGFYIVNEEYAEAKGVDLTRWTSSLNTKIKNWKKEQEFYNTLVKDVRADKVIGAAYRIFLDYTNETYWEEAVGSSFIELFSRLIDKFRQQINEELDTKFINRYKQWLKEWKTHDEDLDITIDGAFIVTKEYATVKDNDLTRWTLNIYRAIITRNGAIIYAD
jgi:hypothetical protein